jgi:hypothetical protein
MCTALGGTVPSALLKLASASPNWPEIRGRRIHRLLSPFLGPGTIQAWLWADHLDGRDQQEVTSSGTSTSAVTTRSRRPPRTVRRPNLRLLPDPKGQSVGALRELRDDIPRRIAELVAP